jgi:hypothetical protein
MLISELELAELKSRTANALRTKSSLADVKGHIEKLRSVLGKSRLPKDSSAGSSIAYLYQLILLAESVDLNSVNEVKNQELVSTIIEDPPITEEDLEELLITEEVVELPTIEESIFDALNEDLLEEKGLKDSPIIKENQDYRPQTKNSGKSSSKGKKKPLG